MSVRRCVARKSGVNCSPSPRPVPISPGCARAPNARATTGSLNGQKIWTSGAHFADFGIIVTRTDPGVPKHQGLTFFFLSMKSPGIEVRRIKQISGTSNFNEVFFTDVRVPRPPDGRVCAGTRMACARGDLVIQFRKGTDIALSCTSARGPCRTTTPL
jgi:hypothetical protein